MKKLFILAVTAEAFSFAIPLVFSRVAFLSIVGLWFHTPALAVSSLINALWRPLCIAWCRITDQTPADWVWFDLSSLPGELLVMNILVIFLILVGTQFIVGHCKRRVVTTVAVITLSAFVGGTSLSSALILRGRATPARTAEAERVKRTFDNLCPVASFVEGVAYDAWDIVGSPPPGMLFLVDAGIANGITFATYATGLSLLVIVLHTRRRQSGPTKPSNTTSEPAPGSDSSTVQG